MKRTLNLGILLAVATFAASTFAVDVKVGGYVDAQYNMGWTKDSPVYDAVAAAWVGEDKDYQTFRLNQGAVRLSSSVSNVSANIDLDFFGPAIVESAGFVTATNDQAFTVGTTQSQAYVSANYENGFDWMLGQFDSRFGYERNDTDSIRYTDQGILWNLTPVTHVGGVLGYGFSDDLRFEVIVANAYDTGALKEGNVDLGAKVHANTGGVSVKLGFLGSTGDRNNAGLEKEFGYLVDADVGVEVADHTLAVYGAYKKPDHKDAIEDFGFGASFGLDPDVGLGYGLRAEYTSVADDKLWQATVGPQYHFNSGFVAKLDYSMLNTNFSDSLKKDQVNHAVNLAAVYSF